MSKNTNKKEQPKQQGILQQTLVVAPGPTAEEEEVSFELKVES